MRRSYTAVVARNEPLSGDWATEPYEAGWATEALFFVRLLVDGAPPAAPPPAVDLQARVQLSPDGLLWLDEGATLPPLAGGAAFVRVREFGNWLRLAGRLPAGTPPVSVAVYLVLKE
jgi:hypothetical protein